MLIPSQNTPKPKFHRVRLRAATVSLAVGILLTIIKLIGASITGSISLLTEGLHSATDVAAATLALVAVLASEAPPDEGHPYGHERIETVSSLAEAGLLAAFSIVLLYDSLKRLFVSQPVAHLGIGIEILAVCAVTTLLAGTFVFRSGKLSDSRALTTNGYHLMSDSIVTTGVLVGLAIIHWTGMSWIDGAVGGALSAFILVGALRLGSRAYQELIDRRLPNEDLQKIRSILTNCEDVISFHKLRTRYAGRSRWIDVHIVVPRTWSLLEAHAIADRLEKELKTALDPAIVITHVDPFDPNKLKSN